MNLRALLTVSLLTSCLILPGCGSKGPLYLPEKTPDAQQPASPPGDGSESQRPLP